MADSEDPPERTPNETSQNSVKIEPIRTLPGNVVGTGLIRTIPPAGRLGTQVTTTPPPPPVIVQAAPVTTTPTFHHHVQTVAKPVARINTVLPGSSYHVPRGAAQVASLAPPRVSGTSTMIKATATGSLQPITVTPHHQIQPSAPGGAIVGRSLVQSANYSITSSTNQATVSFVPRPQIKPSHTAPVTQGGVGISRVGSHVRSAALEPQRPVVLQTTTTHKQIGDKACAVVKGLGANSSRVVTGGRVAPLSGLPPMVPLSSNSSAVLVGGPKTAAPPAAVLVPTKMAPGSAVVKSGAVLVGGKAAPTGVQQAVLVAGGSKAPPPRHPAPLPPATLHQSAIIAATSALITRPVMIGSSGGNSSQGGTIVRSGVVAPHSKYPTTTINQPEPPPSSQPVFIQHKPHIVSGTGGATGAPNTGQSTAILHPQPTPPPLIHSGSPNVPVIPALQSSNVPPSATFTESRRPPTPHQQPTPQSHTPTQVSVSGTTSALQRYPQSSGHVVVVDTKRTTPVTTQQPSPATSIPPPPLQPTPVVLQQTDQGANEVTGQLSSLPLSLTPKQMTSPRPSILRKRDPEGWSPIKAQKNLTPMLTSLSVTTTNVEDDNSGQAAGSGGSSTLSAESSPGEEAPVLALAAPATPPPPDHHDDRAALDVSPRKKPRKQQLPQNNQASEPSAFSDEEMEFISPDNNNSITPRERSPDYYEEQEKRKRMTLWRGRHGWKAPNYHFIRYTDVKPKEDKRPSLTELASQKHALSRINGWKIYHLLSQVEDMASSENEYLNLYSDILMDVEVKQKKMKGRDYDTKNSEMINRISERIKANSARCKVVKDHMDEAKIQIMKLFDHKKYVADLVNKCANKRASKKKERL